MERSQSECDDHLHHHYDSQSGEFERVETFEQICGYQIGKILAHGMIGIVYLARTTNSAKRIVVLRVNYFKKIIEKNLKDNIYKEIDILKEIASFPHVL